MYLKLFITNYSVILLLLYACNFKSEPMKYNIARIENGSAVNKDWNESHWKSIKPLQVSNYMGEKPEHFPETAAKIAYNDEAIYVLFKVEDRYVRSVYTEHQDPVYKDSCVEFFFTPGTDVSAGYFNLEMNCSGTMLFHHQIIPRQDAVSIHENDIQQIEVRTSLPSVVEPEIKEELTWTVGYRIPFSILKKYHVFDDPVPGTIWRANFYKCGDETSHPHWLTWAPIDLPEPDFHRPEFFGEIIFVLD